MTLAMNDTSIKEGISSVIEKAERMKSSGAYLHWFDRYLGTETQALMGECVEHLKSTCDVYTEFETGGLD